MNTVVVFGHTNYAICMLPTESMECYLETSVDYELTYFLNKTLRT